MSTVCAPSLLGSLVDLDVLHNQVAGVETLGVGVGFSVLEETEEELGGLDRPASLGDTESLACTLSTHALLKKKLSSPIPAPRFQHHGVYLTLLFQV